MGLCRTGFKESIAIIEALCSGCISGSKILEGVSANSIDTGSIIFHDLGPASYFLNAEAVVVLHCQFIGFRFARRNDNGA